MSVWQLPWLAYIYIFIFQEKSSSGQYFAFSLFPHVYLLYLIASFLVITLPYPTGITYVFPEHHFIWACKFICIKVCNSVSGDFKKSICFIGCVPFLMSYLVYFSFLPLIHKLASGLSILWNFSKKQDFDLFITSLSLFSSLISSFIFILSFLVFSLCLLCCSFSSVLNWEFVSLNIVLSFLLIKGLMLWIFLWSLL